MDEPADLEKHLRGGLAPRPQVPSEAHEGIVYRLITFYRDMKEHQSAASAPYQPAGEWSDYIAERGSLYRNLIEGDQVRASDILRNFWRNELGPIVSQYAYYTDLAANNPEKLARFTRSLWRDYQYWRAMTSEATETLRIPAIGNPWGLMIDDELVTPQAFRFDLHARQVLDLVVDEATPLVLEIGAGYAGTAYWVLFRRSDTRYVDLDLPETAVIGAYC